jgi:hypothetical protein
LLAAGQDFPAFFFYFLIKTFALHPRWNIKESDDINDPSHKLSKERGG